MFFNSEMKVGQRGFDLAAKWEGYGKKLNNGSCVAYLDTIGTGTPWTIGFGSTGHDVVEGTCWTRKQAEARLRNDLNQKAREVNAYLRVKINQNQFDALVDAAYNLGTHGIHGILDLVNEGKLEEAAAAFPRYNHAQGVVVAGLTRRRMEEKEIFEWETKAEVKDMSPPMQTGDHIQTSTGILGGIGAFLWSNYQQVQEMAKDHVGLILLAGLALGWGIPQLFKWYLHKEFDAGNYIPVGTTPVPEMPSDVQ